MKNQQVNVDYWAMGKAMFVYVMLTALCWIMLRLFNAVFMLPRRLRSQQENMQNTLKELQKRFPDLNITEEDLKDAEKELDDIIKQDDEKRDKENEEKDKALKEATTEESPQIEDKKTI